MTRISLVAAAALLGAGAAQAADTNAALFGKDPGDSKAYACFSRHYEAVHLQTHPKQNVRDMVLFVNSYVDSDSGRQYALTMGVTFRKLKTKFQTGGGCSSTVDGKPAGLACGIDCDGGHIDISVKDETSILVSMPDGAAMWDPNSDDQSPQARFGSDDKLFRLDRTKLSDCLPLASDDDVKAELAKAK